MSKKSEAKEKQGYVAKPVPKPCMNCANFLFDRVQVRLGTSWHPEGWFEDKNMRCSLGGFAVKKMGTCNEWRAKQ